MTVYKTCSDCFTAKPIEQFHTDKTGAAMVRGNCKDCENVKRRFRYLRHQKRQQRIKGLLSCKQLSASY